MGILGGQKIKSPGNVMNCPEKQYNLFFTHPTRGVPGGVGGQHFKSPVNFMNCRENHQMGRSGNFRGLKNQSPGNVMNCREK